MASKKHHGMTQHVFGGEHHVGGKSHGRGGGHKRGMYRGVNGIETEGHAGAHASHEKMNRAHGTPQGFGAGPHGYGAGHTGHTEDCADDHLNSEDLLSQ